MLICSTHIKPIPCLECAFELDTKFLEAPKLTHFSGIGGTMNQEQEPIYPPKPEKICSECVYKHFEYANDVGAVVTDFGKQFIPVCNYPANIIGYNLVDGMKIYRFPSCQSQRDEEAGLYYCGKEGSWFKQKSTAPIKDPMQNSSSNQQSKSKEWDL